MSQSRDSKGRFTVNLDLDATRFKQGAEGAKDAVKGVDAQMRKLVETAGAANRAAFHGFGQSAGAAKELDLGIQKVAASLLGLGAAMRVGSTIFGVLDAGRKSAEDMARDVTKMRDALRDIAAIAGVKGGANDQFLRQYADFRVKTGFRADEAHQFQEMFRGAGELSKGVTIAPEEYDRYMGLLGRFTVAKGGEAGVMGDLGGSALRFRKYNSAEDALGDIGSAYDILSRGKGQNPVLNRQLAKLSAAYVNEDQAKGAFANLDEAAIATSVAAEFDPSASAELTMQALRALRAVNGGRGHEDAADSLRALGVTGKDRFFDALPKLFGALDKSVAGGAGVDEALSGMGFHSDEEKRALAVFYNNRGLLKNQRDFALQNHSAANTGAAVDASFSGDLAIRQRLAEAQDDKAKVDLGMQTERAEILRKEAEGRLRARGELDNGGAGMQDWMVGLAHGGFLDPDGATALGRRMRVDAEAARMLREQGVRVNIPGANDYGPGGIAARAAWERSGEATRDLAAADWEASMMRRPPAGGAAAGDLGAGAVVAAINLTNDLLRQQGQRPLPAEPRNGAPASAR